MPITHINRCRTQQNKNKNMKSICWEIVAFSKKLLIFITV